MGKKAEPLFPDVWWQASPQNGSAALRGEGEERSAGGGNDAGGMANYGSTRQHSSNNSSRDNTVDEDEEGGSVSFLIDTIVPVNFADRVLGACGGDDPPGGCSEFGPNQLLDDEPSDISNRTSSSGGDGDGDEDGSSCSGSSASEYEDEIEQPHRTLGLIFFDFIRFVAISADLRCINTQLMPVFMAWGKMDLLSVALR